MLFYPPPSPRQEKYPFSIAGLNVLMTIYQFLGWGHKPIPGSENCKQSLIKFLFFPNDEWVEDLPWRGDKHIFSFDTDEPIGQTELLFFELFCFVFLELHKQWFSREVVGYMDFPAVLTDTQTRLVTRFSDPS